MAKKIKTDISPANIGELFLRPGEEIPYRLVRCENEPVAVLVRVSDISDGSSQLSFPISEFKDFVMLKPVRDFPRKPRADKGGRHAISKKTITEALAGICPVHKLPLVAYIDKRQCPDPSCDYEEGMPQ